MRSEITRDIDSSSRKHGEKVTSPQFLLQAQKAASPELSTFKALERAEVHSMVEENLRSGQDPSFMGNTYMSEYAKDSEMEHMIDRAYEVQNDIFDQDVFISQAEEYESTYQLSVENIESAYDTLGEKGIGVSPEELPAALESHYADSMNKEDAGKEVEQLKQSLEDFTSSQEILQQIDKRKMEVSEEIETHVSGINEHRKDADMEEYRPEVPELGVRRLRKVEDLMRK